MRYYLAHDGGISDDSDYGNHFIVERYKKGLQGGLGNLVSRITRPKIWKNRETVEAAENGRYEHGFSSGYVKKSTPSGKGDSMLQAQIKMLEDLPGTVSTKMDQLNPGAALHVIMDAVYEVCS